MLPTLGIILSAILLQANCINHRVWSGSRECEVRMRTEAGWVCGSIMTAENGDPYASFLGVPYAKPPVGPRRFKELEPLDAWGDSVMLDATQNSPICPQTDFIFGMMATQHNGMSEDCIYLNIHIPLDYLPTNPHHRKPLKQLPILVFIHGGVFQSGSGLTDTYGPEYLMTQKMIVITFNFRINVFGFLSLESPEIPGNQGLKDMITLLKWVQCNAAGFGGDPNNVNLMGYGSGGTAAHLLSLSSAVEGLFQKCTFISGNAFPAYYTASPKYAKTVATAYLNKLNITSNNPREIHDQLIKMPLLRLMEANHELQYETDFVTFGPVVEKKFPGVMRVLDDFPLTLIANGRGKNYPTLITFTNNEVAFGKFILKRKGCISLLEKDPTQILTPRLKTKLSRQQKADITSKIYKRYIKGHVPTLDEVTNFYTDVYFKYSVLKLAEWRLAIGGAPMFPFKFSYEPQYSPLKMSHWVDVPGPVHMDDLAMVFRINSMLGNHRSFPPKTSDDDMKDWLVYITNKMAYSGNPTGFHTNSWLNGTIKYSDVIEPHTLNIQEPDAHEIDIINLFDSFDEEVRNISARLKQSKERIICN